MRPAVPDLLRDLVPRSSMRFVDTLRFSKLLLSQKRKELVLPSTFVNRRLALSTSCRRETRLDKLQTFARNQHKILIFCLANHPYIPTTCCQARTPYARNSIGLRTATTDRPQPCCSSLHFAATPHSLGKFPSRLPGITTRSATESNESVTQPLALHAIFLDSSESGPLIFSISSLS